MLLGSLLVISSCISEPKVDLCTFIGGNDLHCIPVNNPEKKEYRRGLKLGDQVMSPKHLGELKKHHKELHTEIDVP